jgi:APA family basic amino acid/polyamine antiporter
MIRFFRVKLLARSLADAERSERPLKRALGPVQLTALGIGGIVGAGIFSTAGAAAAGGPGHLGAGPALAVSFMLVAVACGFAALCYAEFAAMTPVAGSAYTYAYGTLGELAAWLIGWDLILEYAVGNVAVAISWSGYFQELLRSFGLHWPVWLGTDYRSASPEVAQLAPRLLAVPVIFNLPALLIIAFITWILVRGVRESASFNTTVVALKLLIILFFLAVGACYVKPSNWVPFAPNGFAGVSSAAAIIFFAYIGFDAVSTAAEESRNPQRDMPVSMVASLLICTVIYVAVAIVLTGLTKWNQLDTAEPLAFAFSRLGLHWAAGITSVGALLATTSVLMTFQLGQPRIFFAMARDGLLPPWAARVHARYRTPHVTTILTGVLVGGFAASSNLNEMVELCNIGTLFAFILVAVGIVVLRQTDPQRARPFRTPWVPWVPLGAIVCCGYLMMKLPPVTWRRFVYWMAAGLVIYLGYGIRHSRLNAGQQGRGGEGRGR